MDNFKDIMNKQPTINVGMIGSVSNGKSSVTERLSGIKTQKHSSEMQKNITIKLGYANVKIFKCPNCPPPQCYQQQQSSTFEANCKFCANVMELKKHISLVDIPGHNLLMATMLNGTCVMDSTILIESASNIIPAPQTKEHLLATKLIKLNNSITCLNKLDLIKKDNAKQRIETLKEHLKDTMAEKSPIIPVVANYGINIDVLCEHICKFIEEPKRDVEGTLKMIIVRSFNINKQDTELNNLEGAVIGGTIMKGTLHINDKVMIYPGFISKHESNGFAWNYKPIVGKVESIYSEKNNLNLAIPGGLIGIKLDVDPGFASKDGLVGNILTNYGNTDEFKIYEILLVEIELLERNESNSVVNGDKLVINSNACNSKCEVIKIKKNKAELKLLEKPICTNINDFITLSKMNGNNIIIMGRAKIIDGVESVKK